MACYLR